MTTSDCPSYAGFRLPAEVISHTVWLSFRVLLSLRTVDELPVARGIIVSHGTTCQWALEFGQAFANQAQRRLPAARDKWHLDEVVLTIAGVKHCLWRVVDQTGMVSTLRRLRLKGQYSQTACSMMPIGEWKPR